MEKRYFYNNKTHRLHILGCCPESKVKPYDIIYFDTYDEALAYDGSSVGLCKRCKKKENKENKVIK